MNQKKKITKKVIDKKVLVKKNEFKYSWDLDAILEGKTYQDLKNQYLESQEKIVNLFKDNPFKDIKNFEEWHQLLKTHTILSHRISNYISNSINSDLSNNDYVSMQQELQYLSMPFYQALATISNLIQKNEEIIRKYLKSEKFNHLTYSYEQSFKMKPHILSEEIQKFTANYVQLGGSFSNLFNTLMDVEFKPKDPIDSKKKAHFLKSRSDYTKLIKSNDRTLRKNTYMNWVDELHNRRTSFAKLLYFAYLEFNIDSKVKNFEGYIDAVNFSDEVPNTFIPHIYKEVETFKKVYENFVDIRKQYIKNKFKLNKVEPWDNDVDLRPKSKKVSIEEAQKITLEALKPLGNEYIHNVKKAFDEQWIDWEPKPNKKSGAYSIGGAKGLKKVYILMNYINDLNSLSTLVHELGHSMHAVEYCKTQDEYAGNSILFAEIPSVANEMFLAQYLLEKFKNDQEMKLVIYDELISTFFATTTRQIIFSEFEYESNKLINSGRPFNAEVANELYRTLNHKYTKTVALKDRKTIPEHELKNFNRILTIPHFYAGIFYVYKYSIGQVGAVIIANRILNKEEGAIEKYYDFMRSGVSRNNLDTIRLLGIDLETSEPWQEAKAIVSKWVEEYKKIVTNLSKKKTTKKVTKK